jgi:hypothetical protein
MWLSAMEPYSTVIGNALGGTNPGLLEIVHFLETT